MENNDSEIKVTKLQSILPNNGNSQSHSIGGLGKAS